MTFPPDWEIAPLQECLSAIIDYRGKTPDKTSAGIPLITAKIVKNGRIEAPNEFIAEEDYDVWMTRGLPEPGDVVITTEAPLGEVAQLGGDRVALAQRIILLRGDRRRLDNTYLRYCLSADYVQSQLHGRASGTTVTGIKQSELRKIEIALPPLAEQRHIAEVLRSLDNKIELNRQMNATLEAMAQALFKSWFVDFDPVKAKAEGRAPEGMDAYTAALFPSEFEESELGLIPKGWSVSRVGDVLELAYGKALKEDSRIAGDVPVYGSNGQVGWHAEALVEGPGIVVGRKGNPGTVTWVDSDFFPIDTTFYVRSRLGLRFLLHSLNQQCLPSLSADSAVPGLNRNLAYKNLMLVPPNELIEVFEKFAGAWYSKRYANRNESTALANIRDALLPRLISGQLRIPDIEQAEKKAFDRQNEAH